ncbi:MAG: hypothetical protein OXB88_10100 [Bacteriovoracales bacterium]|nr:hypothetical protein [Bacteriovoracales bacterium]
MGFKRTRQLKNLSLVFLFVASCSEGIGDRGKIISAQEELTGGNCENAVRILEGIADGSREARWYQTMASAEACSGSFQEPNFFTSGIKDLNVANLGRFLPAISSSSNMTAQDDVDYTSLLQAIRTLKNAGHTDSSDAGFTLDRHSEIWGAQKSVDMILQATYMTVAALGMYMRYYGNGDATGAKGGGSGSNTCYLDYTDTVSLAGLAVTPSVASPCVGGGSGHSDLTPDFGTLSGETLRRACEGVTLFNMLFAFTAFVVTPDDSGELSRVDETLQVRIDACKALVGTTAEAICSTLSQDQCESIGQNNATDLERYFASTFEPFHRGN